MSERLHIITPSCRPQNIGRLAQRYYQEMEPHPFELRWHLLIQGPDPDPKGLNKVAEGMDWQMKGWTWFPSDDALHDPSLFRRLAEAVSAFKSHWPVGCVIFAEERRGGNCPWTGQPWKGGILDAKPENMKICRVDGSQAFFRDWMLKYEHMSFQRPEEADGDLIQRLYSKKPESFLFVNEPLIKFNSLQW
jgi:hypothetical protein